MIGTLALALVISGVVIIIMRVVGEAYGDAPRSAPPFLYPPANRRRHLHASTLAGEGDAT